MGDAHYPGVSPWGACHICNRPGIVSQALGACVACIRAGNPQALERVNSRLKGQRSLNHITVRCLRKVTAHCYLSLIAMRAVAIDQKLLLSKPQEQ